LRGIEVLFRSEVSGEGFHDLILDAAPCLATSELETLHTEL
jgi:hypothetical protein